MKHNLLGAVSTIALGAVFGIGAPGAANATYTLTGTGLTCTGAPTDPSGTCTETVTINSAGKDFNSVNANLNITLDKWYAPKAGDVLSSVSYSGGGNVTVSGTLTNSGSGIAGGQWNLNVDQLTLSGGVPSNFLVPTLKFSQPTSSVHTTLAVGATAPFLINNPVGSATIPVVGSLAGFAQPGNTGGVLHALATSLTSGGASSTPAAFTATQTINETAFVTITYNFTTPPPPPPPPSPTPEPASMALLGV